MTRVAGSNPRIWVDIFLENSGAYATRWASTDAAIEQLEQALDAGDAGFLARWIGEAGRNRGRMLAEAYPDLGPCSSSASTSPTAPVCSRGSHRRSERSASTSRTSSFSTSRPSAAERCVFISGEGEAERAARLLEEQGYGVEVAPVLE